MKHCTFNTSFKTAAAQVAIELGLTPTTSKRQANSGTLSFYDPETGVTYTLHETGYVRRKYKSVAFPGYETIVNYQLNPTEKYTNNFEYNGKTFTTKCTARIMLNPLEQLGVFTKAVANYRKDLRK